MCEPSHFGEKVSSLLTHDGENATGNAAFETDVLVSEPHPGSFIPPSGENFAFLKSHSSVKYNGGFIRARWAVTARGPWHSSVYLAHACSHFACGAILAVQQCTVTVANGNGVPDASAG